MDSYLHIHTYVLHLTRGKPHFGDSDKKIMIEEERKEERKKKGGA